MTIHVLIVDDHPIFREGLRRAIEQDPAFRVLAEAATGAEAIKLARQLRPDVVLMDLNLPDQDGVSATAIMRRELPQTEVVVLTGMLNPTAITQAMQAGANGYLYKDTRASEIRAAIEDAVEGRVHLSPRVTELLVNQMRPTGRQEPLTEREREVLQLLARGASNKEIMQALQIAESTVKAHVRSILSKLGVQSRTQAILVAMRLGLVTAPSSAQ
ncbi:MAG TPA: response regulator transcription factor [Ktedonobacteraceae bacterium]|jgi:NarL family two-component system response regulator LiaR|nr:response regulator transcription factor [Ktedonobacteraceae bacterium]